LRREYESAVSNTLRHSTHRAGKPSADSSPNVVLSVCRSRCSAVDWVAKMAASNVRGHGGSPPSRCWLTRSPIPRRWKNHAGVTKYAILILRKGTGSPFVTVSPSRQSSYYAVRLSSARRSAGGPARSLCLWLTVDPSNWGIANAPVAASIVMLLVTGKTASCSFHGRFRIVSTGSRSFSERRGR